MTQSSPTLDLSVLDQGGGITSSGPEAARADTSADQAARSEGEGIQVNYPLEEPSLSLGDRPLTLSEAVQLGAVDSIFFNQLWFPKTFRQAPALYHPAIYDILNNPSNRYINIQVCRDGAKTTILRAYSAKRIAYGLSHTILYVAINETKAIQSVGWLKHQIETNKQFCQAFGLSMGKPWTDVHICVLRRVPNARGEVVEDKVHVIAFGAQGGVRGVNLDDYRPDLIIVDDVMDDENSATTEQRDKIKNRVLGAIKESLAPRSEMPDAKLVLLNTPQDFEDLSEDAKKDQQFVSASFGCWTKDTEDLAIEEQESAWPARYPSVELRAEKVAALARNKYSIFAREKECKLVVAEENAFRTDWLQFFGVGEAKPEPPRHEMWIEIAIDPVPPPTKTQLEQGLKKKDYEAFAVVGRWRGDYYLLESVYNRGHEPNWTVNTFFDLCQRWSPRKVIVEAVAYQATLAWLLRKGMQKTGRYWAIQEFKDKRSKYKRIVDGLSSVASEAHLYVRRSQTMFISQFSHYPGKNPQGQFDDVLESVAVATGSLQNGFIGDVPDDHYKAQETQYEELEYGGAP